MSVSPGEQRVLYEVRRNLSALGVETRFTARGDRLMGAVQLSGPQVLRGAAGRPPIESVSFTVEGDGLLRVDKPEAFQGLLGPHGAKVASLDDLAEAWRRAIDARYAKLRSDQMRLRGLGLDARPDPSGLRLVARLELASLGVARLEFDGERLLVRELEGGDTPVSFGDLELDLAQFGDRSDLELFLSSEVERLAPKRGPKRVTSGHHFVPDIELDEVSSDTSTLVAGLLPPNVGERWVMEVRVDSDDGEEVRYRGIDITGSSYGAPRVLPKAAFDRVYRRYAQGFRMLVEVTAVGDENVTYVKLDRDRSPEGPERNVSLAAFLANFTAESAVV